MRLQVTDGRLRRLYDRAPTTIAYLDEAYADRDGERKFYIMTAMVLPHSIADDVRDELEYLAEATYWHTTDSYKTPAGREKLAALIEYLAYDEDLVLLCVVDVDLDRFGNDLELARRHCFEELTVMLVDEHAVDLVVYERRREGAEEDADNATVQDLQKQHATRDTRFHGGTPSSETLLWGPDLLASALRRRMVLKQRQWFEPLRKKTTILDGATRSRRSLL